MAQYPPIAWVDKPTMDQERRVVQALFDRAATHGIATVDTFSRLATEPKPQDFYANAHMNARGNQMVASLLAARMPALTE